LVEDLRVYIIKNDVQLCGMPGHSLIANFIFKFELIVKVFFFLFIYFLTRDRLDIIAYQSLTLLYYKTYSHLCFLKLI